MAKEKDVKTVKMYLKSNNSNQNPTCYGFPAKQLENGYMEVEVPEDRVKVEEGREHRPLMAEKEFKSLKKKG